MEIVKILVQNGTRVNAATDDNFTPLNLAAQTMEIETAKFLVHSCANVNDVRPLYAAVYSGNVAAIKVLSSTQPRNIARQCCITQ